MNTYLGACIAAALLMAEPMQGRGSPGEWFHGASAPQVAGQILERLRAGERDQLRRAADRALVQEHSEVAAALAKDISRAPQLAVAAR